MFCEEVREEAVHLEKEKRHKDALKGDFPNRQERIEMPDLPPYAGLKKKKIKFIIKKL